jgi:hypothetical protein
LICVFFLLAPSLGWSQSLDVQAFLQEGRLEEGSVALAKHLITNPEDDQVRFGLGVNQFLRASERVGQSLF